MGSFQVSNLNRLKTQLNSELEELRRQLEAETREKSSLGAQVAYRHLNQLIN